MKTWQCYITADRNTRHILDISYEAGRHRFERCIEKLCGHGNRLQKRFSELREEFLCRMKDDAGGLLRWKLQVQTTDRQSGDSQEGDIVGTSTDVETDSDAEVD